MTVAILLDEYTLPRTGAVELHVTRSFDINVSADEACRQVNNWLLDEVSYMVGAGEPLLVIGKKVVWRVPVLLTATHIGEVGAIGAIDVDVQTGEMDNSLERKADILRMARELAESMPPYTPRKYAPAQYLTAGIQANRMRPEGNPRHIIAVTH